MERNWATVLFSIAALLLCASLLMPVAGCGGGGGSSATSITSKSDTGGGETQTPRNAAIAGKIVKGAASAEKHVDRAAGAALEPSHISGPAAVSGATVKLTPASGGTALTTHTASDGSFSFAKGSVPSGIYKVEITSNDLSESFYVKVEGDSYELISEFTEDGDCYTTIVKPGSSAGWTRDIAPDGSYTVKEGQTTLEEHSGGGITVTYDAAGKETWYLDSNGDMSNDEAGQATTLTAATDSDGDGCHNMRDFDDDDDDNDDAANFDDWDFNTNLLARSVNSVNPPGCINDEQLFAVDLYAAPSTGNAPLAVSARVKVKGDRSAIDKYTWITGKPGDAPKETSQPTLDIIYGSYGKFILTVIVHLKSGEELVDTLPILVMDSGNTDQLVLQKQFDTQCKFETSNCSPLDIDVDQYGNLFVLSEGGGNNPYELGVYAPDYSFVDSLEIGHSRQYISMDIDTNGYVYVLETLDSPGIHVYDSAANLVKTISLSSIASGSFDLKGIAVAGNGDIFFGHTSGIYKCSKSKNFACGKIIELTSGAFIIFDLDIEIDSHGRLVVLNGSDTVSFFTQTGTKIKEVSLTGLIEMSNLAIGPDDTIFLSGRDEGGSVVRVYDPNVNFKYELPIGSYLVWDMFVDQLGVLNVADYDNDKVLVYAPAYIVSGGSAVGVVAAARKAVGGFNVRRVTTLNLN